MEKSHARTQHREQPHAEQAIEDDLRKQGQVSEFGGFVTDSVRRSSQIAAESAGGFAQALGKGFRTYGDSLTTENVARLSLANGFFTGMVRGYATFFDEMGATAKRVLENAGDSPDMQIPRSSDRDVRFVAAETDYDRLAKLVADELKSRGA